MVYILTARDVDKKCDTSFDTLINQPSISQCQEAGDTPYCWPTNGTRICASPDLALPLYWPATFYNPNSFFYVDFGDQHTQGPNAPGGIETTRLQVTLTDWQKYAERMSNGSWNDEKILRITIREWYRSLDSMAEAVHEGPTLILVPTPTAIATPTATPSSASDHFKPGEITGMGIGAFCGLVVLTALAYCYCARCCLACCSPGTAETKRVRAAERRRVRQEREYVQPDVDAIKATVARGEVWQGPARPGGMWVSRSDWPAAPRSVVTPISRVSRQGDEIGAVDVMDDQEERWREEQRRELERLEEQRREEQRSAARREEITRAEETEPPAYEAPPPKYAP